MQHHSPTTAKTRGTALAVSTAALLGTAALFTGAPAHAAGLPARPAPVPAPAFSGDAYGSSVRLGSTVLSGRSAPVTLGCTNTAGATRTNSTASLTVPLLASAGTTTTTAATSTSPSTAVTTARAEELDLLGGLVTASALQVTSTTTRTASGFTTTSDGTSFTDLRVAGRALPSAPAANTRVELPALGHVVLNEQVVVNTAKGASLEVNGVHVVVDQKNLLGFKVGTDIVISHARSGLSAPVAGVLGGFAYGSQLTVGPLVKTGPTFRRVLPCLGTEGAQRATTGAGLDLSPVLTTGAVRNTAQGVVSGSTFYGDTSSTIDATSLLDGLVSATAITAHAGVELSATNERTYSGAGSTFGTLSVAGHPEIDAAVPANTEIALPGVGTLYLHRVLRSGNHVEVRMVELVLSAPVGTLPAGADLRVGVAAASLG